MNANRIRISIVTFLVALLTSTLGACAFLAPIASWPDGQNLLVNGSFEDGTGPGGTFIPNAQGVMSLSSGSTSLIGWSVIDNARSGQDIAWVRNENAYIPNGAYDGTHFLDMTGLSDRADPNGHFGVIRQAFPTIPSARYEASVRVGVANPQYPGPVVVRMAVSPGTPNAAEFAEVNCTNASVDGIYWSPCVFRFDAKSDQTTLSIYGIGGKQFIGIDRADVQCVAPLGRHAWCGGAT